MCRWCGEPAGRATGAGLVGRPAQGLVGRSWQGTHGEAATAAVMALLQAVQAEAGGADVFAGPIIALSWSDRPDGFRTFVGVDLGDAGTGLAADGERVDLPPMLFAADWHEAGDGDVLDHYQALIEWVRATGNSWDRTILHHREEYPRHADFSAPTALRLMLPVTAPQAAGVRRQGRSVAGAAVRNPETDGAPRRRRRGSADADRQAAISALMPSATNCTASAARMTPSSRVRIERPV
ncbi:MAG TPA: hypothetical protein GX405_19650 [Rhizobiales bacterium]|nr:hypothetical protein [Hyphomicrobiales bacterium]